MAQGDKGTKMVPLPKKKDVANTTHTTIRRQVEESKSMMSRIEGMEAQELREYMLQKKWTLHRQMKATIKKLLEKDKPKKKRAMLCPILGAVLKYHKDDDMDPAVAGAVGAAA